MGKPVCEFRIKRVAKGVEVFIKSEMLEEWIRGIADKEPDGGPRTRFLDSCDAPAIAKITATKEYAIDSWVDSSIRDVIYEWSRNTFVIYSGKLNIRALNYVGIAEGVTMTWNLPMSKSMILETAKVFKVQMTQLLAEYAGPVEARVVLTERTVEGE